MRILTQLELKLRETSKMKCTIFTYLILVINLFPLQGVLLKRHGGIRDNKEKDAIIVTTTYIDDCLEKHLKLLVEPLSSLTRDI